MFAYTLYLLSFLYFFNFEYDNRMKEDSERKAIEYSNNESANKGHEFKLPWMHLTSEEKVFNSTCEIWNFDNGFSVSN